MKPATLPERFIYLRKATGLGVVDFAHLVGMSRPYIYRVETGHSESVLTGTCLKMATALGCSPCWVAFGCGPTPSVKSIKAASSRVRE